MDAVSYDLVNMRHTNMTISQACRATRGSVSEGVERFCRSTKIRMITKSYGAFIRCSIWYPCVYPAVYIALPCSRAPGDPQST